MAKMSLALARRRLVAAMFAAGALSRIRPALANEAREIEWEELIPPNYAMEQALGGVIDHSGIGAMDDPWGDRMSMSQDEAAKRIFESVNRELDDQFIKMPGYALPISLDGADTTEFLLAPYVGACIHVPPPPPNQIVFVQLDKPFAFKGLFDPVWVTGTIKTTAMRSELADIGYLIIAEEVEDYLF